eukprot:COSAG03_NODE_6437_length_1060_cov_1.091571_1_plen_76_part_10
MVKEVLSEELRAAIDKFSTAATEAMTAEQREGERERASEREREGRAWEKECPAGAAQETPAPMRGQMRGEGRAHTQ